MLPVLSCYAALEVRALKGLIVRFGFAALILCRMNQFLNDVLTGHQLSGYATSELFHCETRDELLVRCSPLRASSREETEEPIDQGPHLGFESDDVEQVEETPRNPCGKTGQTDLAHLDDCFETCDRRH